MGRHNPNAPTYLRKMETFEKTFEKFLASEDFKMALIQHANHSREWLYRHQTLKLRLLPDGAWEVNSGSWSKGNDCVVTLDQISYHIHRMEEIGELRDFEVILRADPEEALKVLERLYEHQEEEIKKGSRGAFAFLRYMGTFD